MEKIAVICNYLSDYRDFIQQIGVRKSKRFLFHPVCRKSDISGLYFMAQLETHQAQRNPDYDELKILVKNRTLVDKIKSNE